MSKTKILFSKKDVVYDTGKALLVKVPGYYSKVWIPSCFISNEAWFLRADVPSDMALTVIKNKNNRIRVEAEVISDYFTGDYVKVGFKVKEHIPKKLIPEKGVQADDSLKR